MKDVSLVSRSCSDMQYLSTSSNPSLTVPLIMNLSATNGPLLMRHRDSAL